MPETKNKTAKTTKPAANAAKKKPAKSGNRVTSNDNFVCLATEIEGKKLSPQAQVIVNTLAAGKNKKMARKQLIETLEGVLETRQPVGRVLAYYQPTLLSDGYVAIEKVEKAPAE